MSPDRDPESVETPSTPRQEELVDHALALVRESGLPGLTVRRLAQRAGFTEAALYRHFSSKQELLAALMGSLGGRLLGPVREIAKDSTRAPAERLTAIVRHHLKMVLETRGLPILIVAEAAAGGEEAILRPIRANLGEYLEIVQTLLAELPASSPRPSVEGLGLLLLGLPAATALRLRVLPDAELEREVHEELAQYLVDLLAAGAPPAGKEAG